MPSPISSPIEKSHLPSSPATGRTALYRRFLMHPCCRSRSRPQNCTPCFSRSSARPIHRFTCQGPGEPSASGRVFWASRGMKKSNDGEAISSERKSVLQAARGELCGPLSGQGTTAPGGPFRTNGRHRRGRENPFRQQLGTDFPLATGTRYNPLSSAERGSAADSVGYASDEYRDASQTCRG